MHVLKKGGSGNIGDLKVKVEIWWNFDGLNFVNDSRAVWREIKNVRVERAFQLCEGKRGRTGEQFLALISQKQIWKIGTDFVYLMRLSMLRWWSMFYPNG